MTDLFGLEPDPPRKGTEGYLAHLAGLPYPDGLTFWALAPGPSLGPDRDHVWFETPDRQFVKHLVDNRTGELIQHATTARAAPPREDT